MALLNRPLESVAAAGFDACAPHTPRKGRQVSSRHDSHRNPPVAVLPVFHAGTNEFKALRITIVLSI